MNPDKKIELRSGETIGVGDFGAKEGKPVFYFHGLPGSRIEVSLAHRHAEKLGIRMLALDRPGFGLSTHQPRRIIMDWSPIVREIADRHGFDKFSILAVSGGTPYGLACAAAFPERLDKLGIIVGVPSHDWYRKMAEPKGSGKFIKRILSFPESVLSVSVILAKWYIQITKGKMMSDRAGELLPPVDLEVVTDEKYKPTFERNIQEAFGESAEGIKKDIELLISPWGFDPGSVRVPVELWYGGQDWIVPPETEQELIRKIPDITANYLPDEGHFSLPIRHFRDILETFTT